MKTQTHQLIALNRRSLNPAKWLFSAIALLVLLTLSSPAQVPVFSNVWNVVAGHHFDLPAANVNQVRGIALNPVTGNVIYPSITSSNHGAVISAADGSNYLGVLTGFDSVNATNVITGGSSGLLPQTRVADDGAVYACNLSGAPASVFKIYKWASDSDFTTAPLIVFTTAPAASFQWRLGDYMDVRGSGLNTEIVVVGNGSGLNLTTNFVIFKATDATATLFTNFSITIPGGVVKRCGAGVTFEGTNNVIYCRDAGSTTTYRVAYDPTTLTATIPSTFVMDYNNNNGLDYFETNGLKLIATSAALSGNVLPQTNTTVFRAKVMQLTTASNAVVVLNQPLPQPYQTNGNALGLVDFKNGFAVFSQPNNGISLYQITDFITNNPPSISGNPAGANVVAGFNYTLSISAGGSTPLAYQWYFNTNTPLANATNSSVTISNLQAANAGTYNAIVTNLYGRATSSFATVTVLPSGISQVATQKWNLAPGSRDYLTSDNTQRGLAYAAGSQRIVLVSRAPTNGVHLLDAATGADLGDMDQTFSTGGVGLFAINLAGAGDDGAVYVCNLTTSAGTVPFAIYNWSAASNAVEGVTQGSAFIDSGFALAAGGARIGDTFAARGSNTTTELLAAYSTGSNVVLFTTADGINFTANLLTVTNLPGDAIANGFSRLGLAFGPTNTFWSKSTGFSLRLVQYDLAALTASVIGTYPEVPGTEAPLGADNANGLLALIGVNEVPQNLAIYDLANTAALVDREIFASDNANGNGTGAVAFDVAGGRLFSLDSNNGVIAMNYAGKLNVQQVGANQVVTWPVTAAALQSSINVTGTYANVIGATSPYTNTAGGTLFFRLKN